jgi:hypothetical protein
MTSGGGVWSLSYRLLVETIWHKRVSLGGQARKNIISQDTELAPWCVTCLHRLVKNFPSESHPFILATAVMAVFFIAALVRIWLLRRHEEKLLKKIDSREKQILTLQQDLILYREETNIWRAEMQRQFDLFRSTASQHLDVEQKRFNVLMTKSRDREHQLQTSLDIAKQMCMELPAAKARLMQVESMIGLDAGEGLNKEALPVNQPARSKLAFTLLPDIDSTPEAVPQLETSPPAAQTTATPDHREELQTQLLHLHQQNQQLQQALTASRLRSRIRSRSTPRGRNGKN